LSVLSHWSDQWRNHNTYLADPTDTSSRSNMDDQAVVDARRHQGNITERVLRQRICKDRTWLAEQPACLMEWGGRETAVSREFKEIARTLGDNVLY